MNLRVEEQSSGLLETEGRVSETLHVLVWPRLTFRFDSCPNVLLHTLHSYLIFPFCFFNG